MPEDFCVIIQVELYNQRPRTGTIFRMSLHRAAKLAITFLSWILIFVDREGILKMFKFFLTGRMRRFWQALIFLQGFCCAFAANAQNNYSLRSPDRRVEIKISLGDRIRYGVQFKENLLLQDCTLSLKAEQTALGLGPKVQSSKEQSVDQEIEPVVRQKFAKIREKYNELRLQMEGNYAVIFRAYNEGIAYRFETSLPQEVVKIYGEEANFNFAGDYRVYYPKEESFFSHNEREFVNLSLQEIAPSNLASVPAVVEATNGVKIALADSDVESYPGLWFRGNNNRSLSGVFPPYPLKQTLKGDRDYQVSQAAEYIAVTRGKRSFPWRLLAIAEKDGDLLVNQLVYLLEKPSQLQDTSWIKPGKVAWDWWNAHNVFGVGFKSGVNTQTYKYYLDFAAKYGLQYIILDEGWYKLGHQLQVVPDLNMEELSAYARQKNVGIVLWCVWKTLKDELIPAMDQFEKWGIQGIKVDFMQRDDQAVIDFYYLLCREAAKRKMLVDLHGAIRPAAMTRTWPNLISAEGVRGMEQSKWGTFANPEHDVTLPFTRMFLGPMDYTPGAMLNAGKDTFAPIFQRPMSLGTRCHQLGMYVIFESPLQMLSDSPSHYLREPQIMEFLGPVPSVWDETKVLQAKIGDYLIVARRHGTDWYVGAMTDWTARDFELDLSFLPEGSFQMDAYQDGINADRYGDDYQRVKTQVGRTSRQKIHLAEGGGWAARIQPSR
jgi:alpha-glucosidase